MTELLVAVAHIAIFFAVLMIIDWRHRKWVTRQRQDS